MDHHVRPPFGNGGSAVGTSHIADPDVVVGEPECQCISELVDLTGGHVIDHFDLGPGPQELGCDVTSDETRPTGYGHRRSA